MKMHAAAAAAVAFAAMITQASAQETSLSLTDFKTEIELVGPMLAREFIGERDRRLGPLGPPPMASITGKVDLSDNAPIYPDNELYGRLTHYIGSATEAAKPDDFIEHLKEECGEVAKAFQKKTGMLVITLELNVDNGSKVLARTPLFACVRETEKKSFWSPTIVKETMSESVSGYLVERFLIGGDFVRDVKIATQVVYSSRTEFKFDDIKKIVAGLGEITVIQAAPVTEALKPILSFAQTFAEVFFNHSLESTRNTGEIFTIKDFRGKLGLGRDDAKQITITLPGKRKLKVPIAVKLEVTHTRHDQNAWNSKEAKFEQAKLRESDVKVAKVAGMTARLITGLEAITELSDGTKELKTFVTTLEAGKAYEGEDVGVVCGHLLDKLKGFLSLADARALYWAFYETRRNLMKKRDKDEPKKTVSTAGECIPEHVVRELKAVGLEPSK
jgi:hypothetical protein